MDILKYIQDKAFKCEGCLLLRLNSRCENGPALEGLRSDDDIRPCMALPPETEEEWRLGIRDCPGEELQLAMARALSSDMDLPWVPYASSEVLAMISTIPYTYSEYDEVKSMQNDVWGTCIAIIDYILLKRRYDAKKVGQEYNVDALNICRDMGLDYSREEFLKPLIPNTAKYSALVGGLVCEPCPDEAYLAEPIPKRKSSRKADGQYDIWSPKVDKKAFLKHFGKEFKYFDDLVERIEKKQDWKKVDLCRLAFLLLRSGFIIDFKDFSNWAKEMYKNLGLEQAIPAKINQNAYSFKIGSMDDVFFRDTFPFLFNDRLDQYISTLPDNYGLK